MRTNQEHARKQEQFTTFELPDGTRHRIRNKYILTYAVEALEGQEPLSKGAHIVLNAVASSVGSGNLTQLLSMVSD
jgi:hypothetical protein